MYWICWHFGRVPTSRAPVRSVLEVSAEDLLPVCSYVASTALMLRRPSCLHVLLASLDLCSQWPRKQKSLN